MSVDRPLTILIADDHAVVREGLRLLLDAEEGFTVVGEAGDLSETERLLAALMPAVLVLDLHMGGELSLDVLDRLRAASPATGVAILTMQNDPGFARTALARGAGAYVLKEAPRAELILALRTVAIGGVYLHPGLGPRALEARPAGEGGGGLSERETEVLRLLAFGHTNAEIGDRLFLSTRTVESHRASIQRKLGLAGRPELVRYALEHGMMGA